MRLASVFWVPSLLLTAIVSGCGSSGHSGSDLKQAVARLHSAIQTYNRAPQGDILATAATCRRAHATLAADDALLDPSSGSAALDTDLKSAYAQALAGFADCAAAAPYGYVRMVKAKSELAAANTWLARARAVR